MKRFLIIACVSTVLIQLNISSSSNCYGAEGYKSTGSYKGAEGYNGAGVTQSSSGSQNSPAAQNTKNSQNNNNNNSDNQQNADDSGDQFTPKEREQIMQNAQKWFNENPEQAKILNQLLQHP